jgi:hypothetical protein
MPSSKNYKRDYKQEGKTARKRGEVKDRAKRNAARRKLMAEGKVSKGDGKDVDHKKPLRSGGSNSRSNLRVQSKGSNRSFSRKKNSKKYGKKKA